MVSKQDKNTHSEAICSSYTAMFHCLHKLRITAIWNLPFTGIITKKLLVVMYSINRFSCVVYKNPWKCEK